VTLDHSDGFLLTNSVTVQVVRTDLEQLLQDVVILYDSKLGRCVEFNLGLIEKFSVVFARVLWWNCKTNPDRIRKISVVDGLADRFLKIFGLVTSKGDTKMSLEMVAYELARLWYDVWVTDDNCFILACLVLTV
jgi:uncharacterized protein YqgQ